MAHLWHGLGASGDQQLIIGYVMDAWLTIVDFGRRRVPYLWNRLRASGDQRLTIGHVVDAWLTLVNFGKPRAVAYSNYPEERRHESHGKH